MIKSEDIQNEEDVENIKIVDKYEQHRFVNSLIDFHEEIDYWNNKHILPAFETRNCHVPILSESRFCYQTKEDF